MAILGDVNLKRFVATPAVMIIVGIVMLLLIFEFLRGRSASTRGAQSSVVAYPAGGALDQSGTEAMGSAKLDQIQQQISAFEQELATMGAPVPTTPNTPTPATQNVVDWLRNQLPGEGNPGVPVFSQPSTGAFATFLPWGAHIDVTQGNLAGDYASRAQTGDYSSLWDKVTYQGKTYFAWVPDVNQGSAYPTPA